MVVVVDENSGDRATAALEEQLQVMTIWQCWSQKIEIENFNKQNQIVNVFIIYRIIICRQKRLSSNIKIVLYFSKALLKGKSEFISHYFLIAMFLRKKREV